jgi:Membrane proteins related to metalloendopeptidases
MIFRKTIIIFVIFSFLQSCSEHPHKAPVVDATPIPTHKIKTHVVGPGETVYSIALRYDMDYRNISQINGLDEKFRITPGQILQLEGSVKPPAPKPASTASTAASKTPVTVIDSQKNQTAVKNEPPQNPVSTPGISWQWPIKGEVLEKFHPGDGLNKGIDIRGKLGEPVLAAAAGEVVYSGTGLRGYGKLVIVKHNEQLLSAYAHNRVLVVAEGDKVKAGQKIAEVGDTGTDTVKLHFEIRLDGKPVDPLRYLPKP